MFERVLFITGPTSSGKTALGLALAKALDGEVVNADARQFFCDAPIGTGVPVGEWQVVGGKNVYCVEEIPHHLLAVSGPKEVWTVSRWCESAKQCLQEIWSRERIPIVVGGTGLYIRALSEGYVFIGAPNELLRERLVMTPPAERLHQLLQLEPQAGQFVDLKNPHRVLRALERRLSGASQATTKIPPDFSALKIGLLWNMSDLKARVETTIESQFARGWVDEVRGLIDAGVSLESPLMKSIGFRAIARSLHDGVSKEALREEVVRDTWQYVRRQMTWLRKEPQLKWVKGGDETMVLDEVKEWIEACTVLAA